MIRSPYSITILLIPIICFKPRSLSSPNKRLDKKEHLAIRISSIYRKMFLVMILSVVLLKKFKRK